MHPSRECGGSSALAQDGDALKKSGRGGRWGSRPRQVKEDSTTYAALCGQTFIGSCLKSKENLDQMMMEWVEKAKRWDLEPRPASLWWTSTHASEEKGGHSDHDDGMRTQATVCGQDQDSGWPLQYGREDAGQPGGGTQRSTEARTCCAE